MVLPFNVAFSMFPFNFFHFYLMKFVICLHSMGSWREGKILRCLHIKIQTANERKQHKKLWCVSNDCKDWLKTYKPRDLIGQRTMTKPKKKKTTTTKATERIKFLLHGGKFCFPRRALENVIIIFAVSFYLNT